MAVLPQAQECQGCQPDTTNAGILSKHGLADTLLQLVASRTVRIVSVMLGVQFVVKFCGSSRRPMHSKILQVKTTADFVFPVPAVWLVGSGQLHGLL